jgi:hypothetical protein
MKNLRRLARLDQSHDKAVETLSLIVVVVAITGIALGDSVNPLAVPQGLRATNRQLAIGLEWEPVPEAAGYELERAPTTNGPFKTLPNNSPELPFYNDFVGVGEATFYYRIRSVKADDKGRKLQSDESPVLAARSDRLQPERLLTEIQEASFDYFYKFAHPISGLARISTERDPAICAIGSSGMTFFNLGVGIERGFISRQDGVNQALKELKFLADHAERFHGAFPHLINGQTGRVIPFSRYDDGADIVETAFLIEGALFAREYFSRPDPDEFEIRQLANELWRSVEWDWFVSKKDPVPVIIWHWSPNYGWKINLHVTGFNECQLVYLLALASPTHPVTAAAYWQGWQAPGYGTDRVQFGIHLELGGVDAVAPPMFMAHLSYLGLDPHQIMFQGRSYADHFTDFCRVQVLYAESKSNVFKGYGPLWGITASAGPEGYRAFSPGRHDNGTLAPSASLSSMPYVPDDSLSCLLEMYQKYGAKLWGPFGFYDAFNFSRNWVSKTYLCIDEGPIAPMIENYRSGLCWKTFMKCHEIQPVVRLINDGDSLRPHKE